jgi:hypothetical protein
VLRPTGRCWCLRYGEAALEGRGYWSQGAKCMALMLGRCIPLKLLWRGHYGGPRLLELRCLRYGEAALDGPGCWNRGAKCMAVMLIK